MSSPLLLVFLSFILLINGEAAPPCPCTKQSLCQIVRAPLDRKEFFIFKRHNDQLWRSYDWNTVTTIGAFNSIPDPQLICVAHSRNVRVVPEADKLPMDQLNNKTARASWIRSQISKTMNGFYDGINVDLEAALETKDAPLLTSMVLELRNRMKAINPFYQVTFDVAWSPDCIDKRCYDYLAIYKVVDFLFVMSYDMRSQIFGPCVASANTPSDLSKKGVEKFIALGIPANKLVLGLPWYGYDYPCINVTDNNSPVCQIREVPFRGVNCSDAAGTQRDFSVLVDWAKTKSVTGRKWSNEFKSPWYNYLDENNQLHQVWYDDPESLQIKVDWAKKLKVRGVGMWQADCVQLGPYHKLMWDTMGSFFK